MLCRFPPPVLETAASTIVVIVVVVGSVWKSKKPITFATAGHAGMGRRQPAILMRYGVRPSALESVPGKAYEPETFTDHCRKSLSKLDLIRVYPCSLVSQVAFLLVLYE